jgi:zinc/manganese transport system permease protein
MVQAFIATLITGALLSYLGVHVVGRGIVFVDLALGQISSLGVAFAAFIGTGLTSIPLIFTLAGALLMSFINIRDKRLKQEAIIGILYAFASALTVLFISKRRTVIRISRKFCLGIFYPTIFLRTSIILFFGTSSGMTWSSFS